MSDETHILFVKNALLESNAMQFEPVKDWTAGEVTAL